MSKLRFLPGLVAAHAILSATVAAQVQDFGDPAMTSQIREALGIRSWELVDVEVPTIPEDGGFDLSLTIEGQEMLLDLHPHSLRAPDFKVLMQEASGYIEVEPPASSTYKGDVLDPETGAVLGRSSITVLEGQVSGSVRLAPDYMPWGIQPLSEIHPDASPSVHVLYHNADLLEHDGQCGVDIYGHSSTPGNIQQAQDDLDPAERAAGDTICEILIDSDHQFWDWAGGNRRAVICNIEKLMNEVEETYEPLNIRYEITFIILRRNNALDPYTAFDPGTLLNQFCNEMDLPENDGWEHDVAHLMTDRNLDGSVIGIATGVMCFDPCSLSESGFSNNLISRAGLTAHELGHNWAAGHCDGDSDCWIMCSGLGGCGGNLQDFGTTSSSVIDNHRNATTCYDIEAAALTLPVFEPFDDPEGFNDSLFTWMDGNVKNKTGARNELSGSHSMKLNANGPDKFDNDQVRSNVIDLSGVSSATLSFFSQDRGLEAGEKLKVGYYDDDKHWTNLLEIVSSGVLETDWTFHNLPIPADGLNNDFRFRLFMEANELNDKMFIEDLSFSASLFLSTSSGDPIPGSGSAEQEFSIQYGKPLAPVFLYAGFEGVKKQAFNPYKGVTLDLEGPVVLLGQVMADENGAAQVTLPLPTALPADGFYVQALALDGDRGADSVTSAPVRVTLQ